ncbi:hypothetical protein QR685DRAFT_108485 [Neurospora intermedia]|uniref:Uncharacterized protein n=1 Tax=Neurospora intermedia TaxID=5142 RepID=A0ABR3D0Q2_NEUIN
MPCQYSSSSLAKNSGAYFGSHKRMCADKTEIKVSRWGDGQDGKGRRLWTHGGDVLRRGEVHVGASACGSPAARRRTTPRPLVFARTEHPSHYRGYFASSLTKKGDNGDKAERNYNPALGHHCIPFNLDILEFDHRPLDTLVLGTDTTPSPPTEVREACRENIWLMETLLDVASLSEAHGGRHAVGGRNGQHMLQLRVSRFGGYSSRKSAVAHG